MASLNTTVSDFPTVTGAFSAFGQMVKSAVDQIVFANTLALQAEALLALSDAELADRNIKRADIPRYIFSDSYWQ